MIFYTANDAHPNDLAPLDRAAVEADALAAYLDNAGRLPTEAEVEEYVAASFVLSRIA